jgi:hypothetical protein
MGLSRSAPLCHPGPQRTPKPGGLLPGRWRTAQRGNYHEGHQTHVLCLVSTYYRLRIGPKRGASKRSQPRLHGYQTHQQALRITAYFRPAHMAWTQVKNELPLYPRLVPNQVFDGDLTKIIVILASTPGPITQAHEVSMSE